MRIWTIGHSTRSLAELVTALRSQGVFALADVRRHPGSRRFPHFNPEPLAQSLAAAGLAYVPFPELGGLRQPRPDSPNTAWRSEQMRGFADYMETAEFAAALARLLALAAARRTAIMCAEAAWRRCHRGLIADALKVQGHEVVHILGPDEVEFHPYTTNARLDDGQLNYRTQLLLPGMQPQDGEDES